MRTLLTAILAVFLVNGFAPTTLGADPVAADDGTTDGAAACSLQLADASGVFSAKVVVVLGEEFTLSAQGFAPNGEGTLEIYNLEEDELETLTVRFSNDGRVVMKLSFPAGTFGSNGGRRITLSQDDPACSAQASVRVAPFDDVLDSKFLLDIKWAYVEGISVGCRSPNWNSYPLPFCPDGLVTRGQMATFLVRALKLPPTDIDYFTDDGTNIHQDRINRLRAAGITFGCTPTTFCPEGLVTRGQMASFLVRAFDLPTTTTDYFTDDGTNKHEANINRLRAAGVTFGCGGARFCPAGIVTRGQMAAFLHRAAD
ncbi:MAG TPA: S-layer homology domain-containing protein [Candidatus Angelobacter sp.]|nr:S-layer homology domain-containing protein [Candidatus Angelobacter sp.]